MVWPFGLLLKLHRHHMAGGLIEFSRTRNVTNCHGKLLDFSSEEGPFWAGWGLSGSGQAGCGSRRKPATEGAAAYPPTSLSETDYPRGSNT